jgi:DNA polymerase
MKESPANKKQTFAFAKNDEGFIALTEHDDSVIQQLCAVRMGTKSTIEESRIERFINVGARNKGKLPIPLKYYGAHTGRWSGLDSINLQNLPSRDKKKKALKNALCAPEGHYVVNCDSSQIEARVLAWLAGQIDVVKAFADKRDVYCEFASKVYMRTITKENPVERFVGKTCILGLGYGTGAEKLRHTLKTQPPGADLLVDACQLMVNIYRTSNSDITQLWKDCDNALVDLAAWPENKPAYYLGEHKAVLVTPEGLKLPNGLYIRYNKLRKNEDSKWVYASRRGEVNIWGGAMVENIVQALARIIVGQQMIEIQKRYKIVLTVHDAAVCVVRDEDLQAAMSYIVEVMSKPPEWAKGLPVAC